MTAEHRHRSRRSTDKDVAAKRDESRCDGLYRISARSFDMDRLIELGHRPDALQPANVLRRLALGAANGPGKHSQGAERAKRLDACHEKVGEELGGVQGAILRGEAVKRQWIASGELVPARVLAERWGLTPQALRPAARRGEVFALVIKRRRFYPSEFLHLDRRVVAAISNALGHLSAATKVIFFKRQHGALGGRTLLETLTSPDEASGLGSIVQLAKAWRDAALAGAESAEVA